MRSSIWLQRQRHIVTDTAGKECIYQSVSGEVILRSTTLRMINDTEKNTMLALAAVEDASFVELARIAGLDPRNAFGGADLRGVDFQGCDLKGFDFTDADLSGDSFGAASLKGSVMSASQRRAAERMGAAVGKQQPTPPRIEALDAAGLFFPHQVILPAS